MADLYVEALQNGRIRPEVMTRIRYEAPIKLSAALAKESQGIWKKVKRGQTREMSKQEGEGETPCGIRKLSWRKKSQRNSERPQ